MSHPLVAAVWEQLGRHDVANILREVVGEYAAELAMLHVKNGSVSDIESLTRMVFWIKAIFDLQRTYLQGVASVSDCHPCLLPYLLPSDIIFSTLMYLIRVKSELFPIATATTREFAEYRNSIAQTLLAGVRLLLLRGENIQTQMKFNLAQAIRAAWQHPGLPSGESYLVNDLLPRAIDFIGYPGISGSQQLSAAKIRLPSFVSGIYPFSITPETLITDMLTSLVETEGEQTAPFWTLYDVLWAAEAALIQCHVDRRRFAQDHGYSSKAVIDVEEAFEQAEETRKRLARTILVASDGQSESASLQVLATIILNQNANGAPPLQTRRTREAWGSFSHIRTALDNSLGIFVRWLINRRVQLWDCNGELEAVSREYQQNLTHWLHSSSSKDADNQPLETERRGSVVYVVNCPAVHPVPKEVLEEHLKEFDKETYEKLQNDPHPHFITMDVSCPLCPGPNDTKIQHARMIEPLEQLSNALNFNTRSDSSLSRHSFIGSVSRNTTSRSSSFSHSTGRSSTPFDSSDTSRSPISPVSPSQGLFKVASRQSFSMGSDTLNSVLSSSPSDQLREKQTIKSLSRELKNVKLPFSGRASSLRKSLSKGNRLPYQPRFSFSTTGQSLLFWGANSNWVMRFEVMSTTEGQKPPSHRYDVSGVQYAASGNERCAIVASVGEHLELLIFGKGSLTAEVYLTIDVPQRILPNICITMSRNDEYVALSFGNQVHVYRIGPRTIRKITMVDQWGSYSGTDLRGRYSVHMNADEGFQGEHTPNAVIERRLQFSPEGRQLVIATHLGDHYAYVDVWNCTVEPWTLAPGCSRSFKIPSWTPSDGDLTCVFYDSLNRSIFLTAFLGKEYPLILSTSNESTISNPSSIKIAHAAQSPSGTRLAIVNGMEEITVCHSKPNGALTSSRVKKASAKMSSSIFKPGQIILSFPVENMILAFWIKDGKLIVRTIKLCEGAEVVSDYDLRSDFDRLVMERPSTLGFEFRPKRHSFFSSQPVAEMGGSPFIPRPELPELGSGD